MPSPSAYNSKTPSYLSFLEIAMACLASLFALCLIIEFFLLWFRLHPHMPWRDTLPLLRDLQPLLEGNWDKDSLWALVKPHYSAHRVAVLRLLLYLDLELFGGHNHAFYAVSWLSLFTLIGLYVYSAKQVLARHTPLLAFTVANALALLFSPPHLWNFLNPICSGWPLSMTLSIAAFWWLVQQRQHLKTIDILIAYGLVFTAAFVTFSGVIAWLVIPGILVLFRHPAWPLSVLVSAAFITAYAYGVSSDAHIALQINQAAEHTSQANYRETLQSAIDGNTPLAVIKKSLSLIGWPLSQNSPMIAWSLAALSIVVFTSAGMGIARQWYHRQLQAAPWMLWCTISALYCLGNIVAVSLGRILNYDDLLHGPSPERYQTLIVVYWVFISGIVSDQLIKTRVTTRVLGVFIISLVSTTLMLAAPQNILEKEIRSTEFAALLFMVGEHERLSQPQQNLASLYTPHYVLAFNDYFTASETAYHAKQRLPKKNSAHRCTGLINLRRTKPSVLMESALAPTERFLPLNAKLPSNLAWATRGLLITHQTEAIGRLVPQHRGNYSTRQMLAGNSFVKSMQVT